MKLKQQQQQQQQQRNRFTIVSTWCIYRGYYMAARRWEISLLVLKNISLVHCAHSWNIFFNTRREISYLQATRSCSIYYINTNEIPDHFTEIVFLSQRYGFLWSHSNGDIYKCEDYMLFSHVKISSFRAKAHLVFHWRLSNKNCLSTHCTFI